MAALSGLFAQEHSLIVAEQGEKTQADKGKSEFKDSTTTLVQNEESDNTVDDKVNGKDSAPGQIKESEEDHSINIISNNNNAQENSDDGKGNGKENVPGQIKKLEANVNENSKGGKTAPGQNKK